MPTGNQGGGNRNRNSQGEFTSGNKEGSKNSGGRGNSSGGNMNRQDAARKGGEAVSRDREHMAEIGRKGGKH